MIKLNLLSPSQKEYLRFEHIYLKLRGALFIVLAFTVFVSALLMGARLVLQDNLADLLTSSTLVSNHDRPIDRDIATINTDVKNVARIQQGFVKWSDVLVSLTKAIPSNVQITYLNLELATNTFNLNGQARHRDDFLTLLSNLQALPTLQAVTSPPSNLVNRENVSFQLSGQLKLTPTP